MLWGFIVIRYKLYIIFAIVGVLLCVSPFMRAQAVNATLLGTVTDSTGAAVANARITATESKTGLVQRSVSNGSGNYTIPNLAPGNLHSGDRREMGQRQAPDW